MFRSKAFSYIQHFNFSVFASQFYQVDKNLEVESDFTEQKWSDQVT